jgi:hypothetical protein
LGLDGHQLPLPRHPFVLASLAWTCGAASISRQQQASSTPVSLRLLGATRQSGMLLLPGVVWRSRAIYFCFLFPPLLLFTQNRHPVSMLLPFCCQLCYPTEHFYALLTLQQGYSAYDTGMEPDSGAPPYMDQSMT